MNLLTDRVTAQTTITTPLGTMLLAATAKGLAGAWFAEQRHHPGDLLAPVQAQQPHLRQAADELGEFFHHQRTTFSVALDPVGTAFQQSVWQALRRIPLGATTTYGDIALSAGHAAAVRAAGAAIGRNPISVIVPCHRVIGRDGSLTGYAGGLERKQALLALEAEMAAMRLEREVRGVAEAHSRQTAA